MAAQRTCTRSPDLCQGARQCRGCCLHASRRNQHGCARRSGEAALLTPNLIAVPLWNRASAMSSTVLMKCAWPATQTQVETASWHGVGARQQSQECQACGSFLRQGMGCALAFKQHCAPKVQVLHSAPKMKFNSSAPPLSTSTISICSPPLAACAPMGDMHSWHRWAKGGACGGWHVRL